LENHNADEPRLIARGWLSWEPVARKCWQIGRWAAYGDWPGTIYVYGRHGGHVGYADGRVRWLNYEDFVRTVREAGKL
jgi:hypothetical protein